MTLNGHFTLNSILRRYIFSVYFENKCVKTNKGKPILPAAKMFSMDSNFWSYKVYVDIRGVRVLQIFMNISIRRVRV